MTLESLIEDKKNAVDGIYFSTLPVLARILDDTHGYHGLQFWTRAMGYGYYRFCYIFYSSALQNSELKHKKYFKTFDELRYFYEGKNINTKKQNRFFVYLSTIANVIIRPRIIFWRTHIPKKTILKKIFSTKFKLSFAVLATPKIKDRYDIERRRSLFTSDKFCNIYDTDKERKLFVEFLIKNFPTLMLEYFEKSSRYVQKRNKLPNSIKSCVNESFTSDHLCSFTLAVLNKELKIQHWYNEHNKLTQIFKYNTNDILLGLIDKWFTIGWSKQDAKIISSQSNWQGFSPARRSKTKVKNHRVLYVCGAVFESITEFANSAIDSSGDNRTTLLSNRASTFEFLKANNIPFDIKPHPQFMSGDLSEMCEFSDVQLIIDQKKDLQQIAQRYSLVIIEYFSTSFSEILLADYPVMLLYNNECLKMNNEFTIITKLCEASIFCIDIEHNGLILKNQNNEINDWWKSKVVRDVVSEYRKNYVSYGDGLFDDIVKLIND